MREGAAAEQRQVVGRERVGADGVVHRLGLLVLEVDATAEAHAAVRGEKVSGAESEWLPRTREAGLRRALGERSLEQRREEVTPRRRVEGTRVDGNEHATRIGHRASRLGGTSA